MLADSCSASISVFSGPSDDVIQVDELYAIGIYIHVVLELWLHDIQLDHTFHWGKSCIMLALCDELKAANYAQNYAGIIFASLPLTGVT